MRVPLFLSAIAFLFLSSFLSKQKTTLPVTTKAKVSHGVPFTDKIGNFAFLGTHNGFTYGRSYRNNELTIYEIDQTGNLKRTIESRISEYNGFRRNISQIVMVNGHIYLFCTSEDKKADKYFFLVESVDPGSLKASGKSQKLEEIQYEKRRNKGEFSISKSANENRVLLYKNLPYEEGGKEKYELTVFNQNMEEIWKKEVELPYFDNDLSLDNFFIDDEGDVFVSARKWTNFTTRGLSREEKLRNHQYDYMLFSISNNGNTIKEFEIDIEKKWLTDIKFGFAGNGKIVASGFYSERGAYSIRGVFFVAFDKYQQKITKYSIKEFNVDFLYAKYSEKKKARAMKKEQEGKGSGLMEFDFRDLVIRDDGGVILIAEQKYLVVNCTRDPRTGLQNCTYTYYNNDIIVVNISPAGDIEWANWIPKRQVSGTPYFQSHLLHVGIDKMYFLFNDNVKNYSIPAADLAREVRSFGKRGVITMVTMDMKGNQQREVLYLKDPHNLIFVPKIGRQDDEKKSLLFSQKGSKKRFSLLTFE